MMISSNIGEGRLLADGLSALRERLPPGWTLGEVRPPEAPEGRLRVPLRAPDQRTGELQLDVNPRLDPKGALALLPPDGERSRTAVVLSRYLSAATRARLTLRGLGYFDLTGNTHIVLSQPGLFMQAQGATEDPDREARGARSLRGAKAGRIVRALVDAAELPTVRDLAERTGTDPGYVSRVLSLLDAEALIARTERGRLSAVDWPNLLRRWAEEAPFETRGQAFLAIEPRGLSALMRRVVEAKVPYALTGSLAAAAIAPIAAGRLATFWVRDAGAAMAAWGLRPATAGANVLLSEPEDDAVFEGAVMRDGVMHAAPSQVVADLLTATGRGPAEGEAVLTWMEANPAAWRQPA